MDYETCLNTTGLRDILPCMDEYIEMYKHTRNSCSSAMPMEKYLKHWYEAKSEFLLPLFNNNLIIEEPISYRQSETEIQDTIKSKILFDQKWDKQVVTPIKNLLEEMLFDGFSFSSKMNSIKEREFYSSILFIIRSPIVFQENAIVADIELQPAPANHFTKHIHFEPSTKPFKMMKRLINLCEDYCRQSSPTMFDDDFFFSLRNTIEEFRIIHSQCLNTKISHGTLCLSIHPFDYITMSDNGYNWHSCMQWTDHAGEYRTGTIEMMNSPCIVVAYLKGSEPWYPTGEDWTWSNKKWRQLFIVHRNVIAGIKGYPYNSDFLTKAVLNKLAALCQNFGYPAYGEIQATEDQGCVFDAEKIIQFDTDFMYNDTTCNNFLYMVSTKIDHDAWEFNNAFNTALIKYSGPAYCLGCGEFIDYNGDITDTIFCDSCDQMLRCCNCGSIVYSEDDYFVDTYGDIYCEDCYSTCDICGEAYGIGANDVNDAIAFIFKRQSRWDRYSIHVCPSCMFEAENDVVEVDLDEYHLGGLWYYGVQTVALPTIHQKFKDYVEDTYFIDEDNPFNNLVDFSVEQKS